MAIHDFRDFPERDARYGGYIVVCPSPLGGYSEGKTVVKALANIREEILWRDLNCSTAAGLCIHLQNRQIVLQNLCPARSGLE